MLDAGRWTLDAGRWTLDAGRIKSISFLAEASRGGWADQVSSIQYLVSGGRVGAVGGCIENPYCSMTWVLG
jgi:hypothetical protein